MVRLLPLLIVLLVRPIIGMALILLARRVKSMPRLPLVLGVAGAAGGVITALIVFSISTVPIEPYEASRNLWSWLVQPCLLSFYIGFGLGSVLAAVVISVFLVLKLFLLNRRKKHQPAQAK